MFIKSLHFFLIRMRLDSGTCDRSAPEGGTSTGVGAVGSSFRNSSGASSGVGALICVVQTVWCNCSCSLVAQSSAFFVSSAFRRAVSSAFSLLRRCPLVSSTMTAEGLRGRNISSSVIVRLYSGVSDWQRRGGGSGSGDGDGCDLIGEKCDGGSDVANGGNRRA